VAWFGIRDVGLRQTNQHSLDIPIEKALLETAVVTVVCMCERKTHTLWTCPRQSTSGNGIVTVVCVCECAYMYCVCVCVCVRMCGYVWVCTMCVRACGCNLYSVFLLYCRGSSLSLSIFLDFRSKSGDFGAGRKNRAF
jgi:hypothetical protein